MVLTVPKDCLPQGPSADSLHAGLAAKQGTARLGDMVAQCQQHSYTGSHKLLAGNGKPNTAAPGQAGGCLLHRATHSQFAGIHPSPQQVPTLRILGIVLLSTSIQGSSEDLQGKGGCSRLSEERVISAEGASGVPSHLPSHSQLTSHIWKVSLSLSFPLTAQDNVLTPTTPARTDPSCDPRRPGNNSTMVRAKPSQHSAGDRCTHGF